MLTFGTLVVSRHTFDPGTQRPPEPSPEQVACIELALKKLIPQTPGLPEGEQLIFPAAFLEHSTTLGDAIPFVAETVQIEYPRPVLVRLLYVVQVPPVCRSWYAEQDFVVPP